MNQPTTQPIERITIRKFAYLRTPYYSATYHNPHGGSFSMGGTNCRTLKGICSHVWGLYGSHVKDNLSMPLTLETWLDFDANDQPIMDVTETDAVTFLRSHGVTV